MTASQLQTEHKLLVDALKRGESVEITYHGQVLGVVQPKTAELSEEARQAANAFFGMHERCSADTVEDEVRSLRKGRRNRLNDL
jgi:antitoxin (DNA-binding transcriptional repressor) of toxin-antitoxin stability system